MIRFHIVIYKIVTIHITFRFDPFRNRKCIICINCEFHKHAFQVLLLTCKGLDAMDTVERRKLSYRIQLYLEDITHNASFFYYNSDFVLVANAVSEEYLYRLVTGAIKRGKRRMPELELCVGIGSKCMDISQLSISYQRAKAAAHMALTHKKGGKV